MKDLPPVSRMMQMVALWDIGIHTFCEICRQVPA
jgi:hypothetical protein